MRINGTQHPGLIERANEGRTRPAEAADGKARPPAAREAVEVSKLSQKLALARAPETPDAERIARLRSALEAGTLSIDSGAIADAMLREER